MDNNNNHNLIIIPENHIMRINNEISYNRREYYKMIFTTIIYLFIIPFILFLITKKNHDMVPYKRENNSYQIINNNIYEKNDIIEKKRKLNGENTNIKYGNHLDSKSNSSALEEEIRKYLDMILERFGKNFDYLNNLFNNDSQLWSKESLYAQKEKELFIKNLLEHEYKGTWEYYPYNPYESKDEKNFENFYSENFTETNRLFYFNSSQKKFKIGNEQNGTAYINFKKAQQTTTRKEAIAIDIKNLEGKYRDNWMQFLSFIRLDGLKKIIDEKRNKFYFRGEFVTTITNGKILYAQNLLKYKKTCPTLIEAEFPLSHVGVFLIIGNRSEPKKVLNTINNNNFTMILSSLCGFRIKINAEKYDQKQDKTMFQLRKKLSNYFWMNLSLSILTIFVCLLVTYNLNKHQDTVSTFGIFGISQSIVWHSYKSISDVNLGFYYPYFFGPFMILALLSLISFVGVDLRLLILYWKIKKRTLSNRQFISLRLKFFFIFYFLVFSSFFMAVSLYLEKKLILLNAIFLWTPQIIHNIINYNKFSYPLIYILVTTADRMAFSFYFRGFEDNFLNIKSDKQFVIYVSIFIFITILIMYLQVFLGPRFMLSKKYQRVEYNFYRSKAQLLREKPDSINEQCAICLNPIFIDEQNNSNLNNSINDNNTNIENESGNDINKQSFNSIDIMNPNQVKQKNDDILQIANKKKLKQSKEMKLYKNKLNPIIIKDINLNKKKKFKNKNKDKNRFCYQILWALKSIFCNNFFFFYKNNTNLKNRKYMLIKCGHAFHTECLEKWFEMKKECPSCRASMENYI